MASVWIWCWIQKVSSWVSQSRLLIILEGVLSCVFPKQACISSSQWWCHAGFHNCALSWQRTWCVYFLGFLLSTIANLFYNVLLPSYVSRVKDITWVSTSQYTWNWSLFAMGDSFHNCDDAACGDINTLLTYQQWLLVAIPLIV